LELDQGTVGIATIDLRNLYGIISPSSGLSHQNGATAILLLGPSNQNLVIDEGAIGNNSFIYRSSDAFVLLNGQRFTNFSIEKIICKPILKEAESPKIICFIITLHNY
jgi:hypothetical protein